MMIAIMASFTTMTPIKMPVRAVIGSRPAGRAARTAKRRDSTAFRQLKDAVRRLFDFQSKQPPPHLFAASPATPAGANEGVPSARV